MLEGGWRAVVAAWVVIVLVASAAFAILLSQGPGGILWPAVLPGLILAIIYVGIPAIIGILCVQGPVLAFARERSASNLIALSVTALANIVFTILVFSVFLGSDLFANVYALLILAGLATLAALTWCFLDQHFASRARQAELLSMVPDHEVAL